MIESCGFHGRRAAELRLWSEAVRVWTELGGATRRSELRRLKTELAAARRFGGGEQCASRWDTRTQFLGYISGFVCAEGCFGLSDGRPRFSVHLRQDDEPLLQLLAEETGLGNVTRYRPAPPLNPSATWTITRRSELGELRDLLWEAGLPGRKLREMEIWGAAVDEYARAKRLGRRPRRALIERARERLAAARVYRPPERPQLLELPGRDVQSESLAGTPAVESGGRRSFVVRPKYARWRKRGSGATDAQHDRASVRQLESGPGGRRARRSGCEGFRVRPAARSGGRRIAASSGRRSWPRCRRFEREHGRRPAGGRVLPVAARVAWSTHRRKAPCTGCSPAGGPRCFRSRVRRCRRLGRRRRTPARPAGRGSGCLRCHRQRRARSRRRRSRRRALVRGRWTGLR